MTNKATRKAAEAKAGEAQLAATDPSEGERVVKGDTGRVLDGRLGADDDLKRRFGEWLRAHAPEGEDGGDDDPDDDDDEEEEEPQGSLDDVEDIDDRLLLSMTSHPPPWDPPPAGRTSQGRGNASRRRRWRHS